MTSLTIERSVTFSRRGRRKVLKATSTDSVEVLPARVPRVARLMALAIRLEALVTEGAIRDYAEAARLGHVTRARVAQIVNLLNLAPDIQEALLFLPLVDRGRDPITEHMMRPIAAELDWERQRGMWRVIRLRR